MKMRHGDHGLSAPLATTMMGVITTFSITVRNWTFLLSK